MVNSFDAPPAPGMRSNEGTHRAQVPSSRDPLRVKLAVAEWGKLIQIHIDYHLKQFAA
jgi:hypothetical protein